MDLHRESMQAAAVDKDGRELLNEKIPSVKKDTRKLFRTIPKKAKHSWNHQYGTEYSDA